jgi:hypothetical protein
LTFRQVFSGSITGSALPPSSIADAAISAVHSLAKSKLATYACSQNPIASPG